MFIVCILLKDSFSSMMLIQSFYAYNFKELRGQTVFLLINTLRAWQFMRPINIINGILAINDKIWWFSPIALRMAKTLWRFWPF